METVTAIDENYVTTPNTKKKKSRNRKPKASFTADSPYFSAYVDKEVQSLTLLTDTLKDVCSKARKFGQSGAAMAEATRKLSVSCKLEQPVKCSAPAHLESEEERREYDEQQRRRVLQERRESLGPEMATALDLLGGVLDEIADAQVKMCESLVASLCLPLETFASVELAETVRLRTESETLTESAGSSFAKYMHGRHSDRNSTEASVEAAANEETTPGGNNNSSSSSSALAGATSSVMSFFNHHVSKLNTNEGGNHGHQTATNNGNGKKQTVRVDDSKDPVMVRAIATANLRQSLQQIRLSQANGEHKRFQLLRRLDSLKTRRSFELGESALASLHGIRAYFHHCADLTQGLTPRLHTLQGHQSKSRALHESQQAPWEARERGLNNAIRQVQNDAHQSAVVVEALTTTVDGRDRRELAALQPKSLVDVEKELELWDLPRHLAESSLYQRDPTPGVNMEGWLYKKTSSRMTLQTWTRRWFILDQTGIYFLRGGLLGDRGLTTSINGEGVIKMERVKICDIVLCTVREANDKTKGVQGLRYCFEIITPNSKPYMLQACGPLEYRLWVDSIRSCIESQLVRGNVDPSGLIGSVSGPSSHTPGKNSKNRKGRDTSPIPNASSNTNKQRDQKSPRRPQRGATEPTIPFLADGGGGPQFYPDDRSVSTSQSSDSASTAFHSQNRNPLVQRILNQNPTCADCNAPSPDWASLNLGVLLCIECSGVHRSLGVHLSKVRSLNLDDISDPEALVLLALGNHRVNAIYEAGLKLQKGWTKPTGDDTRKVKEDWIKSKYMWKGFLEYSPDDGREWSDRELTFSRAAYHAAKRGDLLAVALAVAKGGSLEWKNVDEGNMTALHACAMSTLEIDESSDVEQHKLTILERIECAEFLIQNGAKIDAVDGEQRSVLDLAILENARREMIEYLNSKAKFIQRI